MTEEETCSHQCADDICGGELDGNAYCDHPGICCECEDEIEQDALDALDAMDGF